MKNNRLLNMSDFGSQTQKNGQGRWHHSKVFRLLRIRPVPWLGVFWLLLALMCTQITLLQVLGYEYAFLFGIAVGWTAPFVSLSVLRRLTRLRYASASNMVFRNWCLLSSSYLLFLLPPALVMLGNACFVRNCAPYEGMLLWLLIPGLTVLFVTALAVLSYSVFRKKAWLAVTFVMLVLLVQPFAEVLSRPQLYSYNHIFGMFIGFSWDRHAPPLVTLTMYRLLTLVLSLMMLAVAAALETIRHNGRLMPRQRHILSVVFLPSLLIALLLTVNSDRIGFTNSFSNIRSHIPGEYRSKHFVLLYDSSVIAQDEVDFIAEEHEFRLSQVCTELGVNADSTLISVIYPDRELRGRLFGTFSSEVARPWKKEIHLSMEGWFSSVKHELVHVMAKEFGPNFIGVPFVRVLGLTEGLAMAVEWDYGNHSLHEYAAAMLRDGMLPSVRSCMTTRGFLSGTSSVGYVAAGSFTRWLIDSYGMKTLKAAYAADNIEAVYNSSYEELESDWHSFLRTVSCDTVDSVVLACLFRRLSLFTALCPRTVGDRSRDALALLRNNDAKAALSEYRELERLAPSSVSAFGVVQSLYQLGDMSAVLQESERFLNNPDRSYSVMPLLLWQGMAYWVIGDSMKADASLSQLVTSSFPGWVGDRAERFRRLLREKANDDSTVILMAASLKQTAVSDSLRDSIAENLLQLLQTRHHRPAFFDEAMLRAGNVKQLRKQAFTLLSSLSKENRSTVQNVVLGRLYYRRGNIPAARNCFEQALRQHPDNKDTKEWLQRCDWKEAVVNRTHGKK